MPKNAKTEAEANNRIAMRDVRQALSHQDWLHGTFGWPRPEYSLTCLVTEQSGIEPEAATIAQDLMVLLPNELEQLGEAAFGALRAVRQRAPGLDDEGVAAAIAAEFRRANLDTNTIALRLAERPAARMRSVAR